MEQKFSTTAEKAFIADLAFPDYKDLQEARQLVDDCLAGQNTIKSKEKYLPPNDWQKEHPDQYSAFLRRALFPGETSYALDIYRGLFSLGNPRINLPANGKLDYIVNRASVFGDGLKAVQKRLNTEQMSHGLRCMLVGVTADIDRPFFIQEYAADKFLRSHFHWNGSESVADFVLLNESTERFDLTDFKDVADYKLRILALDAKSPRGDFSGALSGTQLEMPPGHAII